MRVVEKKMVATLKFNFYGKMWRSVVIQNKYSIDWYQNW